MMRSIKICGGLTRGREITEIVRRQCIYSMHRCAAVHDEMTTATHIKQVSSEQHIDLSISRLIWVKFKNGLMYMSHLIQKNEDCDLCPQA